MRETTAQADVRPAVATLPRPRSSLLRFLPSGRSLAVAFALVAAAVGSYVLARETSMFAVREIKIVGAPPAVAADVRAALAPLDGSSLLALDGPALERRLAELPDVAGASYDRAFPHTLRVFVRPERPVGVLRRGADAWLVSSSGRVIRKLAAGQLPGLARVWLSAGTQVEVGQTVPSAPAVQAVQALATLRALRLTIAVRDIRAVDSGLTLRLASGVEVELADVRSLALKLAIAQRIVPQLSGPGYLDVSVPERPVFGRNPQPGG